MQEKLKWNFDYEFEGQQHSKTKYVIYKIENTISNKYYIGQTQRELRMRWNDYKYNLLNPIKQHKKNGNKRLKYSVQKYFNQTGNLDFLKFSIIEIINSDLCLMERKKEISKREKYWIKEFREKYGYENVWNVMDGGDKNFMSQEVIKKIIESKLKFYQTPQGLVLKEKLSKIHKGKTISEEMKKAVGEMAKKRKGEKHPMYGKTGELNPMYGKKHSKESKQIMSQNRKGKKGGMENHNAKIYDLSDNPLISPTGEIFKTIECLTQFCKKFKLNRSPLRNLLKQKIKQYKKWHLLN
jgi:group I intron endonuclease